MENEIVPVKPNNEFAIMTFQDLDELRQLVLENFGPAGISFKDLPNITVPSGGGLAWEIPGVEGVTTTPTLEGIIVGIKATRRLYIKAFAETGGGTPPDCFSPDGVVGHGSPGGDCMSCVYNNFELDPQTGATNKRCKERKIIFMVMKDDILPFIIHSPATSNPNVTKFQVSVVSKKQKLEHIYTQLSLYNDKSKAKGIKYSKINAKKIGDVEKEKIPIIDAYVAAFKPYLIKTINDLVRSGAVPINPEE